MSGVLKKQLVEVAKLMYDKGMVNAFEGNISILDNDMVYITPSGICKGFLTEEMIVETDLDGNVLCGSHKPSTEIKLHLFTYKKRPDIKSVVHAHSPFATSFAIANKPIEATTYPELLMFFGKIPLAKYGTPSTDEIFEDVSNYINEYDAILLANHGIMVAGNDVYNSFFKLEAAESIAKTLLLTHLLGGGKELPDNKLIELYEIINKRK